MAKKILSEEFRRMQKLAGLVTEDQYMNEGAGIEQFEDYVSDMFNMAIPEDAEEGEYFEDVFKKSEYGDEEEYDTEEWYGLTDYLKSVGGKATLEGNPDINLELMPNGDIKFGATVTLDESLNEKFDSDIERNTSKAFGLWFRAGAMGEKQAQKAKDFLTQKGIDFNDEGRFSIDFQGKDVEQREIVQLLRDNNLTRFVVYNHD